MLKEYMARSSLSVIIHPFPSENVLVTVELHVKLCCANIYLYNPIMDENLSGGGGNSVQFIIILKFHYYKHPLHIQIINKEQYK